MYSLLALMGGQALQTTSVTSSSVKPPAAAASVGKLLQPDEKTKSKKRKGDRRKSTCTSSSRGSLGTRTCGRKKISFADSRMTQNCLEWPRSDDGELVLDLGSGLLHNCNGYSMRGSDGTHHDQGGIYGFSTCQSCGKSAATHELCISSSWMSDERTTNHPRSIMSVASIVVASRNIRCVIGEYYPTSFAESQKRGARIQTNDILPPLNATLCSSRSISNAVDLYLGRILSVVKNMQQDLVSNSKSRFNKGRCGDEMIDSLASIPIVNDIYLLQEKISSLTTTVLNYKRSVAASGHGDDDNNPAALNQVDSRLAAMASCDSVYYRCYYDALTSCISNDVYCDGATVAAIIPHPPTYFSCPGFAWDVDAGVKSLRAYMGELSDKSYLTAPLDESSKLFLLKSWGLEERLSVVVLGSNIGTNPLLALWQSRFIETIRHVWCTRYSAVELPTALIEASDVKDLSNNTEDAHLIKHQASALSPEVSQWRDSIRDYPAHFYAYAAPTTEALSAISNCLWSSGIDQVLEAGAGTGYWSALILRHLKSCTMKDTDVANVGTMHASVQVVPYDVAPPSSAGNGDGGCKAALSNEYHGHVPAFMSILEADSFEQAMSSTSKSSANTALLLCYPPPGTDMAQKALLAHILNGGHTLIHIGEWHGLTGDESFEALLQQHFSCRETDVVPLPLWGTDATYLTIWTRKRNSDLENGVTSYSSALGHCSVGDCCNRARRRCRYVRCLQYCSFDCYKQHRLPRRAMLAMHMIATELGDGLFDDDRYFMDLNEHSHARTMKRKKRKRNR